MVELEGKHLRRLADFAGQLQQQHARAAVAEVDDHVDLLGLARGGRGGADAQLDVRHALQWLSVDVQQALEHDEEVARERVGGAEVADFRVAARGIDGQKEPGRARLNDLPLDIREGPRRLVGSRCGDRRPLPAITDLAGLVAAAAAQRNANDLDTRVGEKYMHNDRLMTWRLLFSGAYRPHQFDAQR